MILGQDNINAVEWKKLRRRARTAFTKKRWADALAYCDTFTAYCDEHGWPDWWADMARLRQDAAMKLAGQVSMSW